MATTMLTNKRPTKKLRDRLEVQDRFRTNLESIIKKYDKPFEDSPVLNLEHMSVEDVSLREFESLDIFCEFGRAELATDVKEGKKRRGGISSDSALGSLPQSGFMSSSSASSSAEEEEEDEDEEGGGDLIHLENLDFTHERSDGEGAFVRYRYTSRCEKPGITGREDYQDDISGDSSDDLESVCSGPTRVPEPEARDVQCNRHDLKKDDLDGFRSDDNDGVFKRPYSAGSEGSLREVAIEELDDSREEDDRGHGRSDDRVDGEQNLLGDRKAAVEKVNSWLRKTSSAAAAAVSGSDISGLKESSSELETEDISQPSTGEYPPVRSTDYSHSRCDETTSLFELRERFVRKVHSILVEGNNETDDVSSSAEEADPKTPTDIGSYGRGQKECKRQSQRQDTTSGQIQGQRYTSGEGTPVRRSKQSTSEMHHRYASQDKTCLKTQSKESFKQTMDRGNDSTILAGHFDESDHQSPIEDEVLKDGNIDEMQGKCIELVQTPGGAVEWRTKKENTLTYENPSTEYPQRCRDVFIGPSSASMTPERVSSPRGNRQQTPRRSLQSLFQGQTLKPAQTVQKTGSVNETPMGDPQKDILNNIVDFFKSPLPQLLNSPMPLLSPNVKQRTVRGKRVRGPLFKEENVKSNSFSPGKCTRRFPSQITSPTRGKYGPLQNSTQDSSCETKAFTINCPETEQVCEEGPGISESLSLNASTRPTDNGDFKFPLKPKVFKKSISSSEDDSGDVFLLDEDSSDAPTTPKAASRSAPPNVTKTPVMAKKSLERVSKTPTINSPFSHMSISSGRKTTAEPARTSKIRTSGELPVGSLQGMVCDDSGQGPLDHSISSGASMEVLQYSSHDDDEDEDDDTCDRIYNKQSSFPDKCSKTSTRVCGQNVQDASCFERRAVCSPRGKPSQNEIDDEKAAAYSSGKSERDERRRLAEMQLHRGDIDSDTFLVAPGSKVHTAVSTKCQQSSSFKSKQERLQSLNTGNSISRSSSNKLSSPRRAPSVTLPMEKTRGNHLQEKSSTGTIPVDSRADENCPKEDIESRPSSHLRMEPPKDTNCSKPLGKAVVRLSKASRPALEASFLSSTRLDEDPPAAESINRGNLQSNSSDMNLNEVVIKGNQIWTSHNATSRREDFSSPQALMSPQRALRKAIAPVSSHNDGGASPMRKCLTPSKRRRPGSDRANSMESPAKRRTPEGVSEASKDSHVMLKTSGCLDKDSDALHKASSAGVRETNMLKKPTRNGMDSPAKRKNTGVAGYVQTSDRIIKSIVLKNSSSTRVNVLPKASSKRLESPAKWKDPEVSGTLQDPKNVLHNATSIPAQSSRGHRADNGDNGKESYSSQKSSRDGYQSRKTSRISSRNRSQDLEDDFLCDDSRDEASLQRYSKDSPVSRRTSKSSRSCVDGKKTYYEDSDVEDQRRGGSLSHSSSRNSHSSRKASKIHSSTRIIYNQDDDMDDEDWVMASSKKSSGGSRSSHKSSLGHANSSKRTYGHKFSSDDSRSHRERSWSHKPASSSSMTTSALDMLTMSSICEGPGRCTKAICFTCAGDDT